MEQAQIVFTKHYSNERQGQWGPFFSHDFVTADGIKFGTVKQEIANAAYALAFVTAPDGSVQPTNQPILVSYSTSQNEAKDGSGRIFTNHKIEAVQAVGSAGEAMAPGVLPLATATSQGAPTTVTQTASTVSAPVSQGAPTTSSSKDDDVGPRIARSVAFEHLPKYCENQILELPQTSEELYDLLGAFSKWIFDGSRPQRASDAGASSAGVGGGDAGAAPSLAAPAPTQETVPTDDIPF